MLESPFDEAALRRAFTGRHVLLTGHTGFKGSWLALWLHRLGAKVTGIALPPPAGEPSLFRALGLEGLVDHRIADLRDEYAVALATVGVDAEIVIHLAAQPLVRRSYEIPADTYLVNVVGTARVLDAARSMPSLKAAIVVTSDKCYENAEWLWGYRESDPMGGADPYSASKGCAELLVASYRRSFFHRADGPALATVRAGNVIGGGDWSQDRLVPDMVRAAIAHQPVLLRNRTSIRPWQHVLEPLAGYLQLAAKLAEGGQAWAEGWNFGPGNDGMVDVQELAGLVARCWDGAIEIAFASIADAPHEARALRLDSSKARQILGWQPRLSVPEAVEMTVNWYRAHAAGADMQAFSLRQIQNYAAGATARRSDPSAPGVTSEAA